DAVDIVPVQPIFVDPPAAAAFTDKRRQARHVVGVHASTRWHGRQDRGQLGLLSATEPDSDGEQFGLSAIGDDYFVFADRMPIPPGYDTELQQHLLHVDGQLLAAR